VCAARAVADRVRHPASVGLSGLRLQQQKRLMFSLAVGLILVAGVLAGFGEVVLGTIMLGAVVAIGLGAPSCASRSSCC